MPRGSSFSYTLNRKKLRQARRREGRYLLRTNLCGRQPAELWQFYIQLTEIEAAFKHLKDDLRLRPIYHQLESRIEAHIFVAFMAYCLGVPGVAAVIDDNQVIINLVMNGMEAMASVTDRPRELKMRSQREG